MTDPVVVIGTGMGGIGAGHRIAAAGRPAVLVDRNPYPGGHTATFPAGEGFLFDDGPHVSFTKDERIRQMLTAAVEGREQDIPAGINSYWHGHRIDHPVQMHLFGLPTELVVRVIRDFVAATAGGHADDTPPDNYEAWLRASYGDTFAETFPMVYGLKYHTTTMDRLTTDWLGPRMYRPSLDELLTGALGPRQTNTHYVTSFRYPTEGGFASYIRPLLAALDVRLGAEVVAIDPRARTVTIGDGTTMSYPALISSLPLPELIRRIVDAPEAVREAAEALSFTTAVVINIGVDREDLSDRHITYAYDEDVIFSRINFPHLLSPNVVPPGAGSIQAEIYFSDRYRPLVGPPEALIERAVADLIRMGTLREDDRLLVKEARPARYANVIYDRDRPAALATVNDYLDEVGILRCGRYGNWDHAWTDESFLSGERAADRVLG
jgi:protoporphyrinogen oxidase